MNLLSPQNYIPSNISSSMDHVEVSLRSAPVQLQKVYYQKYSSDAILKFSGKEYPAHRYVLQKTSDMFIRGFITKNGDKWEIDIRVKGKTDIFSKILSCMYGFSTTIRRFDIHQAYNIAKALQIPSMLNLFFNDMVTHFDDYDIFPLLKLATEQNLQQVIELCYDQLEIEMFEPMRYNKSGLFLCGVELFKSIINKHNRRKSNNENFGLSHAQIMQIIDDYSFVNGLDNQTKTKMIEQITREKQNIQNHKFFKQLVRKPSTPQRTKSTSEIFYRPTLTLPREKDQQKNHCHVPIIRRLSPHVSPFIKSNGQLQNEMAEEKNCMGSSPLIHKSAISDKSSSLSNISTEHISQKNRSRRQSSGSVETVSNSKENQVIFDILTKQTSIREDQNVMKIKASDMLKKLNAQFEETRQKARKLHKLQSSLEQLKAQMVYSQQKINQLNKTVNNLQDLKNKMEIKQKFDRLFEVSLPLDLTASRQISVERPLLV